MNMLRVTPGAHRSQFDSHWLRTKFVRSLFRIFHYEINIFRQIAEKIENPIYNKKI